MSDHDLMKLIAERSLISLRRDTVDENQLQGFPLACSASLLALAYVCDFRRDGYLFLRREDISDIKVTATDKFQRGIMIDQALLPDSNAIQYPLESFESLLSSLPENEIAIIECETSEENEFTIGRYVGCNDGYLAAHYFSGAGNWDDELTFIDQSEVTCVQLQTNYALSYQKYFDVHGFPAIPND